MEISLFVKFYHLELYVTFFILIIYCFQNIYLFEQAYFNKDENNIQLIYTGA